MTALSDDDIEFARRTVAGLVERSSRRIIGGKMKTSFTLRGTWTYVPTDPRYLGPAYHAPSQWLTFDLGHLTMG